MAWITSTTNHKVSWFLLNRNKLLTQIFAQNFMLSYHFGEYGWAAMGIISNVFCMWNSLHANIQAKQKKLNKFAFIEEF